VGGFRPKDSLTFDPTRSLALWLTRCQDPIRDRLRLLEATPVDEQADASLPDLAEEPPGSCTTSRTPRHDVLKGSLSERPCLCLEAAVSAGVLSSPSAVIMCCQGGGSRIATTHQGLG
jgi:hypothetical protein